MNRHGRPRLPRGFNWHHAFWHEAWYDPRDDLESRFREHKAAVVPTREFGHMALHAALEAPLKPTREQMGQVLVALELWTPADGRLGGLEIIRDEFRHIYEDGDHNVLATKRAELIADNITRQMPYLDGSWRRAA